MTQLFATSGDLAEPTEAGKVFGVRGPNGMYHMPLLPGEGGPKAGGDWVPRGIQSVTNLVGAFEETRALAVWEMSMSLAGLALDQALYEELTGVIHAALISGVKLENMREYPALKEALAGSHFDQASTQRSIAGRARELAKAGAGAARGTAAHATWEERGRSGRLAGDAGAIAITLRTEKLLAEAGLVRVPHLSERVVRNCEVRACGRFDDVLLELSSGRLLMADLKTKPRPFYSYMTVDAQLATYAYAEWMLAEDGMSYEPGPREHVDLAEGVIMHVPSDGGPAMLERADLVQGWETAKLARLITDHRSAGKSAGRLRRAPWGA